MFVIDNVALHVYFYLGPSSIICTIFVWLLSLMLLVALSLVRFIESWTRTCSYPRPTRSASSHQRQNSVSPTLKNARSPGGQSLDQHTACVVTRETSTCPTDLNHATLQQVWIWLRCLCSRLCSPLPSTDHDFDIISILQRHASCKKEKTHVTSASRRFQFSHVFSWVTLRIATRQRARNNLRDNGWVLIESVKNWNDRI